MIRTFETHKIRKQKELTNKLWKFVPATGDKAGKEYDFFTPCCWESHPDFINFRGVGIFKTTFNAKDNIRLEFKGVSHTAKIKLDGKEIKNHYNAYTAFDVIIKDLKEGNHILEISADNRFSEASALHVPNDYMSYGGVSRPVVLEEISKVYIKSVHVTPFCENNKWKTRTEIELANISDKAEVVNLDLSIADKNVIFSNIIVKSESIILVTNETAFENVNEWLPENPVLYFVQAVLKQNEEGIDDYIDRFGFREVKISGKDILFNGNKLKIKGICRHEDHPQFGCALPANAIIADLQLIKSLGANSIRTSHYPNDEVFLDFCDELGILIWEENHARGLSFEQMENPNFEKQAEQVIDEMITQHYNHPCIYIWGILNECASDTEYGKECYSKQLNLIKKLDQSRPHSYASCKFKTDICFGLPDVDAYNIYPLWYHDTDPAEYVDELYTWIQNETEGKGKPFLITEIGAGGIYGFRNPSHAKWTEEYQAEALKKQLEAVLSYKDCSGVYIWQFCDVRVSDEWFGGRPRTMNNKGIFDEYRRPKLCFDVVKKTFKC